MSVAAAYVVAANQKMRHSWRLLSNSCTHLHKSMSLACTEVRLSSICSPFHTQSRTETTIEVRNPIYTASYRFLQSKSCISCDFSSAGDAKRDLMGESQIEEEGIDDEGIEEEWDQEEWIDDEEIEMECNEKKIKKELVEELWDLHYYQVVKALLKFGDPDDINRELTGIWIDHDLMKIVFEVFESNLNVAKRFFHFILEKKIDFQYEFYSSLYNSMLCVFGVNGLLDEFWDLAETMNTKRHLISSSSCVEEQRYLIDMISYDKVSEFFAKCGLVSELEKLNMFVAIQYMNNSTRNIAGLFSLRYSFSHWETFKKKFHCEASGDFVKLVLEQQEWLDLKKALLLFWWIDGVDSYEHHEHEQRKTSYFIDILLGKNGEGTYHFIASVLGKDNDSLDKYWKLVDEMMSGNYERELRRDLSQIRAENIIHFIKNAALEFYENALSRSNSMPSVNCCIYLLMKLALTDFRIGSEHVSLHSLKVVDAFEKNGGILTDSMVCDLINMFVSENRTLGLNWLADLMCHHSAFAFRNLPSSVFQLNYRDRQRRGRYIFSALHKEIYGCTK